MSDADRIPGTSLRFSGGEAIDVALSLDETHDLIWRALTKESWLDLHTPDDGRRIIINPHQIQYLQNSADIEATIGAARINEGKKAVTRTRLVMGSDKPETCPACGYEDTRDAFEGWEMRDGGARSVFFVRCPKCEAPHPNQSDSDDYNEGKQ